MSSIDRHVNRFFESLDKASFCERLLKGFCPTKTKRINLYIFYNILIKKVHAKLGPSVLKERIIEQPKHFINLDFKNINFPVTWFLAECRRT